MQFDFKPVNVDEIIGNVELTVGQVSKLGGVSARQVEYWTQKGIIMPKNPSDTVKRYSIDAVIKIRLINQCLNIGMTLDSADRIVSRYMDLHDKKEAMGSGDAVKDEEAGNGDEAVNDEEDGLKGFVYTRIGDAGPMAEGEGSMAVREGLPDVGGSLAGSYFYPREDARKLESKIDDLKERLSLIERVVERISDSIGMINSIRHGGDILG